MQEVTPRRQEMKRRLYRGNPSDALKTPDPLPFTFCSGGSFALFTDGSLPMVKQAWRANPVSGLNATPHYVVVNNAVKYHRDRSSSLFCRRQLRQRLRQLGQNHLSAKCL
jgi:hypothetical protein